MGKLVSFLFYAATASALAIRDTACTPGPTTVNGQSCTIECGVDHPGGDNANQYAGDLQTCVNACASDSNCDTAQFSTTNGYCYLKSAVNPGSANANVNGVICRTPAATTVTPSTTSTPPPVACTAGPVTLDGRSGNLECGIDHPGGDYAAQYAGTLEACENLCANDNICLTAQYDTNTGYCYLKSSINPTTTKSNVDGIVFSTSAAATSSTTPAAATTTTTTTSVPVTPSTTSTASASSTPTASSTCLATAPTSPYISSGGFEQGLTDWSVASSLFFTGTITKAASFEGCASLSLTSNSSNLVSSLRLSTQSVSIFGLTPTKKYQISFKAGSLSTTSTSTSAAPNQGGVGPSVQLTLDKSLVLLQTTALCGWKASGQCTLTGAGGAVGQLFTSSQFQALTSTSTLYIGFVWPVGALNGNVLLDDVEITPV